MRRWLVIAGSPIVSAAIVLACTDGGDNPPSGDASVYDGPAYDGKPSNDYNAPDLFMEPPFPFEKQVALALCNRMQGCCGQYDGGTFDSNACVSSVTKSGWEGFNAGLAIPGVKNVMIDPGMAQACIAGLSTLTCPSIGSAEYKNVTLACSRAIVGTQTTGGDCVDSIECRPSDYCSFDPDGGKGRCATLLEAGAGCNTDECSHINGPNPPLFCGSHVCAGLRANDQTCLSDNECQSGICTELDAAPSCADAGCGCSTDRDFRYTFCGVPYPPPPPSSDAGDAGDAD
jgi:hypothetical protein